MPTPLKDLVSQLRDGRDKHPLAQETELVGEPLLEPVAAIDGGSSMLWSNGRRSIGVVRWGYVVYEPTFEIRCARTHSEFLLVEEGSEQLDEARHRREVEMIREAASHARYVLVDGALDASSGPLLADVLDDVTPETAVVGVSKKSSLSATGGDYPETWYSLPPRTYVLPSMAREKESTLPGTTLSFASLHALGPTLRIDVAGDLERALRVARHYAGYRLCPGYPFPLTEAHRACCLDDKKHIYETMLQREMGRQGLLRDYVRGKKRGERTAYEIHTVLDGLV